MAATGAVRVAEFVDFRSDDRTRGESSLGMTLLESSLFAILKVRWKICATARMATTCRGMLTLRAASGDGLVAADVLDLRETRGPQDVVVAAGGQRARDGRQGACSFAPQDENIDMEIFATHGLTSNDYGRTGG